MMQVLTEESAAGRYVVVTASKSVYEVTIGEDGEAQIIRRPLMAGLLLDGQPMTGVSRFTFDSGRGYGQIRWAKLDAADYDDPSSPYTGTARTTSRVLLIAAVPAESELFTAIRDAVLASGNDYEMHASVQVLLGI